MSSSRSGLASRKPYPPQGMTREWWQRLKNAFGTASSAFVQAPCISSFTAAWLPRDFRNCCERQLGIHRGRKASGRGGRRSRPPNGLHPCRSSVGYWDVCRSARLRSRCSLKGVRRGSCRNCDLRIRKLLAYNTLSHVPCLTGRCLMRHPRASRRLPPSPAEKAPFHGHFTPSHGTCLMA